MHKGLAMPRAVAILALCSGVLLLCDGTAAQTWIVDQKAGPYWTIGSALSAASSGDTILIRPGVYREVVTVSKNNIALVGDTRAGKVVLDGRDPVIAKRARWERVQGHPAVYRIPFKWSRKQPTTRQMLTYQGGRVAGPIQVFEDGVILRGYRGYRYATSAAGKEADAQTLFRAYNKVSELDPDYWDEKKGPWGFRPPLERRGRFMYAESQGLLYVQPADGQDPSTHQYEIAGVENLIQIKADNVIIRNLTFKNTSRFAVYAHNVAGIRILCCDFPQCVYPVMLRDCENTEVAGCVMVLRGFRERYWYRNCKGTVFWHGAVSCSGKRPNHRIHDNRISGHYMAIVAKCPNIHVYRNRIDKALSASINATDNHFGEAVDYNCEVFANVISSDLQAVAVSFNPKGPIWVHHNLFMNCGSAMKTGNATARIFVFNNTSIECTVPTYQYADGAPNQVFRNEIIYVKDRKYGRCQNFRGYKLNTDYMLYWHAQRRGFYATVDNARYDSLVKFQQAIAPIDAHSRSVDPLFVDPGTGDFRLAPRSPAWTGGIAFVRGRFDPNARPVHLGCYGRNQAGPVNGLPPLPKAEPFFRLPGEETVVTKGDTSGRTAKQVKAGKGQRLARRTPETEKKEKEDAAAAAEAVREKLRADIIAGIASGKTAIVYVEAAGVPTRARMLKADTEGFTVELMGKDTRIAWADVAPSRFLAIAKKYSKDAKALEEYARTNGLQ